MTRRPTVGPAPSALYAWLQDREEAVAARPRLWPDPGNQARLAALHAGQPIDVGVGALPDWARPGETTHWWRRAVVAPTGSIRFYDDDGSKWLEEQGL